MLDYLWFPEPLKEEWVSGPPEPAPCQGTGGWLPLHFKIKTFHFSQ